MPRRSRKETQAHTRACLLEAAAKVFTRRGLERASVEEVSEEAGFTKGAFYANFKSKQELFLAMLDERFAAKLERLEADLAGEDDDPGEEARRAAEDIALHSDPEWAKLFFEFTAYAAKDEDFRQEFATRYRALQERMTEIIRRWSADFPEPPLSLEDITLMTCCMANGFMMEKLIEPELPEELSGMMQLVFFRGLQALSVGWEPPTRSEVALGRRS
jgi:AcrR family transcriptional regulator